VVNGSLGVLLSGAFVYWEVGRYAAPQVPLTLFDERKELFAYTAGLFGGIVLSIPFGLFLTSLAEGSLGLALIGLALLVVGMELGQWVLRRSVYFGSTEARPFYAVGFRAGASAILVLTLAAIYLGGASVDAPGVAVTLLQSGSIVTLQAAGALLAVRLPAPRTGASGGPLSSGLVTGVGFLLLGLGGVYGPLGAGLAAALVLVVSLRIYGRLRGTVLGTVRPPTTRDGPSPPPSAFGRTDR